jgi:hypothetical protein
MNDQTAKQDERDAKARDADEPVLDGKSFQVNENSVEEGESLHPDETPPRRAPEKRKAGTIEGERIEGTAFEVNEDSAKT